MGAMTFPAGLIAQVEVGIGVDVLVGRGVKVSVGVKVAIGKNGVFEGVRDCTNMIGSVPSPFPFSVL